MKPIIKKGSNIHTNRERFVPMTVAMVLDAVLYFRWKLDILSCLSGILSKSLIRLLLFRYKAIRYEGKHVADGTPYKTHPKDGVHVLHKVPNIDENIGGDEASDPHGNWRCVMQFELVLAEVKHRLAEDDGNHNEDEDEANTDRATCACGLCPNGELLTYSGYREGAGHNYRQYLEEPKEALILLQFQLQHLPSPPFPLRRQ
jgi:hypothetical protein